MMKNLRMNLATRGARHQFSIGVALLTIIPLLGLLYLVTTDALIDEGSNAQLDLALIIGLVAIAAAGYVILWKYPANIIRLRTYTEGMARGDVPDKIELFDSEDDISAIEKSLDKVVSQLRDKVSEANSEHERQLMQSQKMESLGQMASGLAHDYNNLLAGIIGNVSLALQETTKDEFVQDSLKDVEESARHAMELTSKLMTYSGKGQKELEDIDIAKIVRGSETLIRASIPKSIDLAYEVPDTAKTIQADPTQIRQILINLAMNASDSIAEQPGLVTIAVGEMVCSEEIIRSHFLGAAAEPGHYSYMEVCDTGQGLDSQDIERIFDPFYSSKKGGRGLGLSVVWGIVRSHKGIIHVESELGKGSIFRILFPCAV